MFAICHRLGLLSLCLLCACGPQRKDEGAAIYAANCAICHGADGTGGGGAGVPGLSGTPSDLTRLSAENGGVFPVRRVVAVLGYYTAGTQTGRRMHPMNALEAPRTTRLRAEVGRVAATRPQAAVINWLQSVQRP